MEPEPPPAPSASTLVGARATAGLPATVAAARSMSEQSFGRGFVVGRYVIRERLGAGAMGVVYGAYDPELDRKLALKFLKAGRGDYEARARLLREAQAMAKLAHPNVVTVHDVGTFGDEVFVAMEFVHGLTLKHWLDRNARSWRDVVEVFVAVGRGLAAAHDAGLVHRDLKPENIMVGNDERVRVMDFGLARASAPEPAPPSAASMPRGRALALELTRTGSLVGTPVYMAPEQWEGGETDARTDQFSFCVALWEALYGERPFEGATLAALSLAVTSGQRQRPPGRRDVPIWLRRVIDRGLAVRPDDRWPDMSDVLAQLERGRTRARLKVAAMVLAGLAVIGAGIEVYRRGDLARRITICDGLAAELDAVWNDGTRAQVRDAILDTRVSFAATSAEKILPWLDGQAAQWKAMRSETCMLTRSRVGRSPELKERSLWCLEERRMELESLIAELARADPTIAEKAVPAAAGLSPANTCLDADLLTHLPAPPAEQQPEIRAFRVALSHVDSLARTGQYDEGVTAARANVARTTALAWPPLRAAALLQLGGLLKQNGEYPEAERTLEDAYFAASEAGAPEIAADAGIELVELTGSLLARRVDGRRWSRQVELILSTLGETRSLRTAQHLYHLASMSEHGDAQNHDERALEIRERVLGPDHPDVALSLNHLAQGYWLVEDFVAAKKFAERALAIRERALGHDHPDVARSVSILADVQQSLGAHAEARALYERALQICETALGPDHPLVATTLSSLADLHLKMGDRAEARSLYARALAIDEKALGPAAPAVAAILGNLASIHSSEGQHAEAKLLYRRGLAIYEKVYGARDPHVAALLGGLADVHTAVGDHATARKLNERALATFEEALGRDHPVVVGSLLALAGMHRGARDYREAQRLYERALAIREKAFGSDDPRLAAPLAGLAEVAIALRRAHEAVRHAERATWLREKAGEPPEAIADTRFVLVRALWDAKQDPTRAIRLAESVRDVYKGGGAAKQPQLAEVNAWLRRHARGPLVAAN